MKRIYGWKFLVLCHPLSNFEITKYFNYEPIFNSVFSKHNLSKAKDGSQDISLGDKHGFWIVDFILSLS